MHLQPTVVFLSNDLCLTHFLSLYPLQESTTLRAETHKLQTTCMQKDAEVERKCMEIQSLQHDKGSLDKLLQEKENEVSELQSRLQAAAVSGI